MGQEELEKLIEQSRAGDRQAQEQLVLAVQDQVYYHCRKMLKNPDDAQDATQDILMAMLKGLDSLQKPGAFRGWLSRITSNTCCRRLSRDRMLLWEDESAPLDTYENLDDQVVPDKALDNEEVRRMVVELVESLPEAQRLSVLFYYYDEMSVKEIAEAMDTSENTVKSRLYYAREAIRKGVSRYTAQGLQLYGLTPVPFLRYFLQKEAAEATAVLAGKAALAASAGAAAAAASSAAGGASLTGLLGGILAHKGAAALAGLALAGAITGGVLLHQPKTPAPEPPDPPAAALPEIEPETEPALAIEPSPEAAPPVLPTPANAPPKSPAELPPESEEEPPSDEEPVQEPEDEPDQTSGSESERPVQTVQYEPNPDFGSYLGETPEGVHEFIYTLRLPAPESQPSPLLPGDFYSKVEISGSPCVGIQGTSFYGIAPGESDVEYYVSETEDGPYTLKALVHVTVLRELPILPDYDHYPQVLIADGNVFVMEKTIYANGEDQPQPLVGKGVIFEMESRDPAIAGIRPEGDRFYGIAPGYTEILVYARRGPEEPRELKGMVCLDVQPVRKPVEGTKLCTPLEDFSPENGAEGCREAAYHGMNVHGLYDFTVTVREGDVFQLRPLATASGSVYREIKNYLKVDLITPEAFRAVESGTTDIIFSVDTGTQKEAAVVHVTVLPAHAPYYPNPDFGEYLGMDENVVLWFRSELVQGRESLPCPLQEGGWFLRVVSSDPSIVRAWDGNLYGKAPGSAEVRYYVSAKEEGPYTLQAVATVEVKPAPAVDPDNPTPPVEPDNPTPPVVPDEPEVTVIEQTLEFFGQTSGYGSSASFSDYWNQGTLPEELKYESSDPAVICVNENGDFTTLSAGTASLTAVDPNNPGVCYRMNFQVQDHFDWRVYLYSEVLELKSVGMDINTFSYTKDYYTSIERIQWTSSNESVVTAQEGVFQEQCRLYGHAPGDAEITGTVQFRLTSAKDELLTMTDVITFQVHVS